MELFNIWILNNKTNSMQVPFTVMAIETFKIPTSVTNQPHCLIQFWTTCSSDKLESYVFHQVITKTGEPETTSPTTADCSPE